jgi:hypothetical protein
LGVKLAGGGSVFSFFVTVLQDFEQPINKHDPTISARVIRQSVAI